MITVFGRQLAGGSLCLSQPGLLFSELQASQGLIMRPLLKRKEREGGNKGGREGRKGEKGKGREGRGKEKGRKRREGRREGGGKKDS